MPSIDSWRAPIKTVNFSNIFLILRNFKGTPNILILSKNSRYNISRRYIRFNISLVIRRLKVKMLSTNPIYIIDGNGREVVLIQGLSIEISNLLPSLKAKTNKNQTSNLRFGKDNAVYIQKWGLKRKGSYILVVREPYLRNYDDSIVRKNIIKLREYIIKVYNKIDLKPKNILIRVNDDGLTPKIADFRELKFKALGNIITITSLVLYMAPKLYIINLPYSKAINIYTLEIFRSMLKGLLYKKPDKKRPTPVFKDNGYRNRRNL
ncbi:kinase-like protein [Cenococcum geophilum]